MSVDIKSDLEGRVSFINKGGRKFTDFYISESDCSYFIFSSPKHTHFVNVILYVLIGCSWSILLWFNCYEYSS